ncbi:MAG: formyltransferase family protein, partial [Candidatus Auribacterota bacterium]|nr:formyltransferase family protein [Candidatus Auribacterota bacterium]
VVGIGLVPFDPRNKGLKFYSYYLRFLGIKGFGYKALQVLKQIFRRYSGLSRLSGPPASIVELASRHGLPLLRSSSPNKKVFREEVAGLSPDLIISSQGFLLKKGILSLAPLGCLNRHAALLPQYRGIYPIFWAMLHDEREIGVSVHFMNEKYDDGRIIVQEKINVEPDDTFFSLYGKVIEKTPDLFLESIRRIEENDIPEISNRAEDGEYFSYPGTDDFRLFREKGKRMI